MSVSINTTHHHHHHHHHLHLHLHHWSVTQLGVSADHQSRCVQGVGGQMGTFFRVIGASGSDEDGDAGEDQTEGSLRGTRTHWGQDEESAVRRHTRLNYSWEATGRTATRPDRTQTHQSSGWLSDKTWLMTGTTLMSVKLKFRCKPFQNKTTSTWYNHQQGRLIDSR